VGVRLFVQHGLIATGKLASRPPPTGSERLPSFATRSKVVEPTPGAAPQPRQPCPLSAGGETDASTVRGGQEAHSVGPCKRPTANRRNHLREQVGKLWSPATVGSAVTTMVWSRAASSMPSRAPMITSTRRRLRTGCSAPGLLDMPKDCSTPWCSTPFGARTVTCHKCERLFPSVHYETKAPDAGA